MSLGLSGLNLYEYKGFAILWEPLGPGWLMTGLHMESGRKLWPGKLTLQSKNGIRNSEAACLYPGSENCWAMDRAKVYNCCCVHQS